MRTATNTKKAFVALALATAAGLTSANVGPDRLDKRQAFTGRTTVYIAETGNEGTCGGFLSNSGMTVALNSNQWDGGSHCGQQLTINYQGRSVTVTVRDQCPGCPFGSLDLTPGAWSAVTGGAAWGEAYTSWSWGGGTDNKPPPPPPAPSTSKYAPPPPPPPPTSTTPKWTPPATSQKPSSTWTPPTTSRTSTTSSSSVWTPPTTSSSSTPPPTSSSSSSTSSSTSSSSVSSSAASSNATISSAAGNSTAVSSALGNLVTTTLSFDNGTASTATLAIESGVTSTLTAPVPGSTVKGALGTVNQVVLQMANIVVNAVEADN